jgi:hypothetical protein
MHIHAIAVLLVVLGVGSAPTGSAQTVGYNFQTGDLWLDARVAELDDYGTRHQGAFVDELVELYAAPRALVLDLLDQGGWLPGDVLLACAIAQLIGEPCHHVVAEHERAPGRGWGVTAKRLGIQPGSAQFHELKRTLAGTSEAPGPRGRGRPPWAGERGRGAPLE